eukprot:355892-Chlamydomonas_euryale.AAC.4
MVRPHEQATLTACQPKQATPACPIPSSSWLGLLCITYSGWRALELENAAGSWRAAHAMCPHAQQAHLACRRASGLARSASAPSGGAQSPHRSRDGFALHGRPHTCKRMNARRHAAGCAMRMVDMGLGIPCMDIPNGTTYCVPAAWTLPKLFHLLFGLCANSPYSSALGSSSFTSCNTSGRRVTMPVPRGRKSRPTTASSTEDFPEDCEM